MLAAVFEQPGSYGIKECEEPRILNPDDIKISVQVAGVCGTDAHIVSNPQRHLATNGIILGHEFVGEIVEMGTSVKGFALGDRVIAGPNISCGQCEKCRRGRLKNCENNQALGITRDGGFAQYVVAPARAFYPIPKNLPSELAVFAEPLSCVLNGFNRLNSVFGKNVVILGGGPAGLYFTKLFRHFGALSVHVSEPHQRRREIAIQMGATQSSHPDDFHNISEESDIVVDTTGFLLTNALKKTRSGGQVLVFGLDKTCQCTISPYDLVRNEKSILGCFIDNEMIPVGLDLIQNLHLNPLISHRYSLKDLPKAIAAVNSGEAIKSLIYPGGLT